VIFVGPHERLVHNNHHIDPRTITHLGSKSSKKNFKR